MFLRMLLKNGDRSQKNNSLYLEYSYAVSEEKGVPSAEDMGLKVSGRSGSCCPHRAILY